ncbi:MAG TPA: tetratricopeptide repeat protein [Polyangiales bacterium]|nr:tetratricopeptide repeat protein [Polyangiales bacterium]
MGGVCLALLLCACAHAPAPVTHVAEDPERARLRMELTQRDQVIVQLEGRLALAEAGQRQLRAELQRAYEAQNQAPTPREGQRDSVRIGRQPAPEPPTHVAEEKRPSLVLHNDRQPTRSYTRSEPELASTWTPPVVNERLSVVPLPEVPRRSAAPAPAQVSSDDLYLRALDLLRRKEFAEAQRELDAFVATRPRDPRVGKAHFFRAELMYAERDYKRALAAYEDSLASDPSGDKAPDAMLRSALCQLGLGARDRARATLQALRAKFPDSEAAHKSVQVMQENSG